MTDKTNILPIYKRIIYLFIVGSFTAVWLLYYNNYAFRTHLKLGAVFSVLIFWLLYYYFSHVYGAFKIATYSIPETVFSQILSFGLADLILWIECCLIYRQPVSLWPGLLCAAVQIAGVIVLVVLAKNYFIHHVKPSDVLIIYGRSDSDVFRTKLEKKYSHMFHFREAVSCREPMAKLEQKINQYPVIFLFNISADVRKKLMEYCTGHEKQVYITPRAEDLIMQGFSYRMLIDTPVMKYEYYYDDPVKLFVKRLLDIIFSVLFLAILSPVFVGTMIAIKAEDGGPVFFRQKRCTKNEKVFDIIKFRSMKENADRPGEVNPYRTDDERVTKVGHFIRRFRIDELPQFLNILRGDMSIVGPRPERVEHVRKYDEIVPEFRYRSRVKAGLTGYGQIYGKYNTSPYDKALWDLAYIENQSVIEDIKIVFLTFKAVFVPESTEGFDASVDIVKMKPTDKTDS